MGTILIVEHQRKWGAYLKMALKAEGYQAVQAEEHICVRQFVRELKPDLVLIGLGGREKESWMLLWRLKQENVGLPVLAYHAHGPECVRDIKRAISEALAEARHKFSAGRSYRYNEGAGRKRFGEASFPI